MKTKDELPECPVATTVSLIGSKWKLLIIRNLKERPWRFNELQRSLEGISQKVLTESLRQMIDDGLVNRIDFKSNPPHVEYSLSDIGKNLLPIINIMSDFGNYYKSLDI
ncbi:MAG: helix-turn-helix transcriptional regulator [Anaeroplasmataceae bacterium]|nr:helix-turn-helix transcriptional regulator [Anaeroplasmataceae bacterium]